MCPSGRSLRTHSSSSSSSSSAATSDFRPAFDILDADRDGKISRDDLRAFYAGVYGGVTGGDDVIGAMMTVADINKDGFVEYEEFERVVNGNAERRPLGCGAMEDVFRVMDKDGDGRLSHQDLKSYMAWAGFAATDEDITAMIKFGGGDQNGGVNFDGLLRILALDDSASN
ncbi:calcium-binding protein CP1 [Gastrolobium bilobum]|uniref:calcium-binding protein CP1 n=1 Tax=Gastrolobium bilobum TaxID=150636 RepID=UPI002AAFC20D|nr:calcium-binding protein CP1 [Gastrolobium bilobum]